MAVTVGYTCRNVHLRDTVSSAPVARLREQGRSSSSLIANGSMEANGGRKDDAWMNGSYEDKAKKDKKWSIGKLFRRKKKDSESDSGSSDDNSQGKKKKDKKGKLKHLDDGGGRANHRSQSVTKVTSKEYFDEGVLSDPSAGFVGYVGRGLPRSPLDRLRSSKESLDRRGPESSCGSQDGSLRKGRKGRLKARAEAIRMNMKHESSSDEESQRSTSSSIVRFKSDDSLFNSPKGDLINKRTRTARTDRYMKRLSRDEEVGTAERESEAIQRAMSKKDSESFSQRQRILSSPQINGSRDEVEYCEPQRIYQNTSRPERSMSGSQLSSSSLSNLKPKYVTGSNSSVYSYPAGIISLNAKVNDENISYSIPYSNANKQAQNNVHPNRHPSQPRQTNVSNNNGYHAPNYENDDVMVVKFPLGNVAKREPVVPPVPPPRDPQRKVPTPLSYMYDNIRPVSYNFDNNSQRSSQPKYGENRSNISTPLNVAAQNIYENSMPQKSEGNLTWNKRPISTSEDHIAMQQSYPSMTPQYYHNNQPKRPSSVTAEVIRPEVYNRYINRPSINQDITQSQIRKPAPEAPNQDFLYFADKTPRSRKPIHITPGAVVEVQNNVTNNKPRSASEFWRKMDSQEVQRRRLPGSNRTQSDLGLNGNLSNPNTLRKSAVINQNNNVQPQIIRNGDISRNKMENRRITTSNLSSSLTNGYNNTKIKPDEPICYSNIDIIPMDDIRKEKNNKSGLNSDDESKNRKKTSNLDDALSELEAIYNSLGLGDEDLLDRAEKRELMSPKVNDSFPFDMSQNDYLRHPDYSGITEYFGNRNPMSRRSSTPDKLHDDMAFRRLNPHERPKSKDVNSLVSQMSYMLASPVLMEPIEGATKPSTDSRKSEPDIVLDDVAFRNIRQAKNYLKTIDPQPPFGIPLGPVSPSPYSNYLHGPDTKEKLRHFNQDTPDVVMDDLAYRALRKDCKSVTFGNEDDQCDASKYQKVTEPSAIFDNHVIKKKRAVRSLSANIFTMIQKEIDDALELYNNKPLEKTKSIPDLPDSIVQYGRNGPLPQDSKNPPLVNYSNINKAPINKASYINKPANENARASFYKNEKSNGSNPFYGMNYEKPPENASIPPKSNERLSSNVSKSNKYPVKVTIENKFKSDAKSSDKNGFSVDYTTSVYTDNPHSISINRQTNIRKEKSPEPPRRNLSPIKVKREENLEQPQPTTGQSTEDSLIQISNHLNKLGDRLKPTIETQDDFEEEGKKLKALALKCNINLDDKKSSYDDIHNIKHSLYNQDASTFRSGTVPETAKLSSDISTEKEQLEKMPSFEDLRKGITDLLHGISQVTDKFNIQPPINKIDNKPVTVVKAEEPVKPEELSSESPLLDEDVEKSKDNRGSPEYNSSEELAMIFNLNKDEPGANPKPTIADTDKHSDLNSPRLVKTANQNFAKQPSVERELNEGECSKQLANNDYNNSNNVPWRRPMRQTSKDNETKGNVQDHEDFHRREIRPEDIPVFDKPSIFHSSSAFRPVKPKVQQPAAPKVRPFRERPFFEDIKSIASRFGDVIDYTEKRRSRDATADVTFAPRKIRKRPERRATTEGVFYSPVEEKGDMPEARLDAKQSPVSGGDAGTKMDRMRKYKEERRKQLAEQSALRNAAKTSGTTSRRLPASKSEDNPTTSGVRTTRASRLRAAASCDSTTRPKPTKAAGTSVFVDSTNHNQRVPPSSSLVLVDSAGEPDKENGRQKCDIDAVIDNISSNAASDETRTNGNGVAAKTKQRRSVGDGGAPATTRIDNGNSSPDRPTTRNGGLTRPRATRSSSQSPLSPTAKTQKLRPSASEIELKPIVNGSGTSGGRKSVDKVTAKSPIKSQSPVKSITVARRKESKSGDSSSEAEPAKKRSSSLVTESKLTNGTRARAMAPVVDKGVKQIAGDAFIKSSSVDMGHSKSRPAATNRRLTSRMDALEALTKETFAKVNRLAAKKTTAQDKNAFINSKVDIKDDRLPSNEAIVAAPSTSRRSAEIDSRLPPPETQCSIISTSCDDRPSESYRKPSDPTASMISYTPISILKRKSLQEDHGSSGNSSGNVATPPVTFSPSVVDPPASRSRRYGQGILKKRRSLDESQVNRHRSCSPEVAFADLCRSKPTILKGQRRSSLEEVVRGRSPDGQIQSILKRKSSRDGDFVEDRSLGSPEPQSILKRKSNSSSGGSTSSSHVSITQAVILAAAKGAVLVEDKDSVRPILKKKSFSEEKPCPEIFQIDGPKPILKKKSLTESDHSDHDRPAKTILKHKLCSDDGNSSSFDHSEDDRSLRFSSVIKQKMIDCDEPGMRPILKHSREHSQSPKRRLSLCSEDELPSTSQEGVPPQELIDRLTLRISPDSPDDDDNLPKNSKFTLDRLQSPSLVKGFFEDAGSTRRPRNRSRSLVTKLGGGNELEHVLLARRSLADEPSRESSPEESSGVQRFPSIAERIQSMELNMKRDLGAVPKRQQRNSDRFRTQPITVEELQNLADLDVGQANFQRHVAAEQQEDLVSRRGARQEDTLDSRRPSDPPHPSPFPTSRDPYAKLRHFDPRSPPLRNFDELTFTPESLKSSPARRKDDDDESSPVTREFNRLFKDYCDKSNGFDWNSPQQQSRESFSPNDALRRLAAEPKPKGLFDGETSYQKGGREAKLQELDRLEIELEDLRTSLDADSSALCGVDPDHWSLNVSADSGVYHRMSSGDSGHLSGEEHSLHHDTNKPSNIKMNKLGPVVQKETERSFEITDDIKMSEPSPEPVIDNPRELFGLMKSNSVSARASMWQQMHAQANRTSVPPPVKPFNRHSRMRAKDSPMADRFKTQPITFGEVNEAAKETMPNPLNQSRSSFNLSLEQDEEAKLDENDPAKLTLAEKMKLFGASTAPKPPMCATKKTRSPRFQTMPILASEVEDAKALNLNKSGPVEASSRLSTSLVERDDPDEEDVIVESISDRLLKLNQSASSSRLAPRFVTNEDQTKTKKEIGDNFRLAHNKLAEQASRMLTSEVRGILKSRSGAIPLLPPVSPKVEPDHAAQNSAKSPLLDKSKNRNNSNNCDNTVIPPRGRNAEGLKDEGIESSSDEEILHSSQSSDDSCSSSESSDESDNEKEPSPPPCNIKPSQLKASKTESDIAKRSPNAKTDLGIKLPCMDEMRARQIMERCMAKSEKENVNSPKPKILVSQHPKKPLSADPLQTKANNVQDESAFVKVRNLKNGGSMLKSPIVNAPDGGSIAAANLVKKFFSPTISKSMSVSAFGTPQLRPLDSLKPPSKFRNRHGDEGSGSDGESSGGREVRQITSRRRNIKGQQAVPPPQEPQPGLRRSATQPMAAAMPQQGGSIAERLKALQQSGNNDWRKRVSRLSPDDEVTNVITVTKNRINETLTQQHEEKCRIDPSELATDLLISDRRNQLETSAQGWKKRVGQNDATLFSVAGRMDRDKVSPPTATLLPNIIDTPEKKTPIAARFKSRRIEANSGPLKSASSAAISQPASPHKRGAEFKRSISVSGVDDLTVDNSGPENVMAKSQDDSCSGPRPSVPVPRADDETFTSFFTSASQTVLTSSSSYIAYSNNNNDIPLIDEEIDLDVIDTGSRHLLGAAATSRVRATRRAGGSKNPLRALAARTDILQEYTEPPSTGFADKEAARLKKEKLMSNAPMAVEALAGLASREDFANIHLKKATPASPPWSMAQGTQKMLIHIKGRRRVQARLVEPHYNSINSGDSFILVTNDNVFLYIGYYANVIERTRGAEIALHIHSAKDLGCANSTGVITMDEQAKTRSARHLKQFWTILGLPETIESFTPAPAGNADEDEIFESGIIPTNMCYEVYDDELVPIQEYWGQIPKIAMLDPSKILVFDFGSELYVWNGKNTILEKRRTAFQLAQELWDEGYDYKDCAMCPVSISQVLGARTEPKEIDKSSNKRPEWAMIAKVTQHMENILFRDKFLDWPDFTRVIKVKEEECLKNGSSEIKPFDAEVMWKNEYEDPSLELEGSHVGRGTHYYDKETMRHFEVKTQSITKWMIQEYDYVKITKDLGEFYSADSYIIRWEYQLNVTGRELTGKPSKHNLTGRDRCAYFCWQGKDASPNEKGAAALLTVELDQEKGPQVRISQGTEPPAFLNLFKGSLVIHQGKKGNDENRYKLYTTRGNIVNESHAIQVACSMRQLRSRSSMLLVDTLKGHIYVWHGAKSLKHTKSIALDVASQMAFNCNSDVFSSEVVEVKITEVNEGDEPKMILDALGGANRQLYHSLIDKDNKIMDEAVKTPRLFHFTDISGEFVANEILSPLRHPELVTAYPFSQNELYSASQPGLFMIDDGQVLWLWQGWVPQSEESDAAEAGAGSGNIRWQLCRKAAMETVLNYLKIAYPDKKTYQAYLTVAGLEPLQFTNMFDIWLDRDDVAEINIGHGYDVTEGACNVNEELARLSRTSFPLAILRQRPLPDGVDPANIERYLTPEQFLETFGMAKTEFYELPSWKQVNMKKDLGLF